MSEPWEALLPAAGFSRRLGRPKGLIPTPDGRPLLRRSLDRLLCAGAQRVWVALPHREDPLHAAVARLDPRVRIVAIREPERGLGNSLAELAKAALADVDDSPRRCPEWSAQRWLVSMADQHALLPADFARLLAAPARSGWLATRTPDGRAMVPVLLTRTELKTLRTLTGDRGLRETLQKATRDQVLDLPRAWPDLDRAQDLAGLK